MGLIGTGTAPGRWWFSSRRRKQIRRKEQGYDAWQRFKIAAAAEHAQGGGKCTGIATGWHGATKLAHDECLQYGSPAGGGMHLPIYEWLHAPSGPAMPSGKLQEMFEQGDAEGMKAVNAFP